MLLRRSLWVFHELGRNGTMMAESDSMRMRVVAVAVFLLILAVAARPVHGADEGETLRVPSQYPTILAGLQASTGGGYGVGGGGYVQRGGEPGSDAAARRDAEKRGWADATVIDCGGTLEEGHFGVHLAKGRLEGFTIINGVTASHYSLHGTVGCFGNVTVSDCIIQDNIGSFGGGFFATEWGRCGWSGAS